MDACLETGVHYLDTANYEPKDEACLLYTSDAADERSSVDLGGRRIIKKKKNTKAAVAMVKIRTSTEQDHR